MRRFETRHLVLTSVLGFALGLALGVHLPRWGALWFHRGDPTARRVEHLSRALKLSPEQRQQLAAILEDSHRQMMTLNDDVGRRMTALRTATHARIDRILDPGQRTAFASLTKKWEARHPAPDRFPGPPGGPGPAPRP